MSHQMSSHSQTSTSNLEPNATTLTRTKDVEGEDHDIHLAEIIDEHSIRVEEDLTEWTGSVETGSVVTGDQLFIYGQGLMIPYSSRRTPFDLSILKPTNSEIHNFPHNLHSTSHTIVIR